MTLQPVVSHVDQSTAMGSTPRSIRNDSRQTPSATERHEISLEQLAHELNSLLDGSIRCVELARRMLDLSHDDDTSSAIEPAVHKLHLAQESMRHMAVVLSRVMRSRTATVELLSNQQNLGETLDRVHQSLRPMATQSGVTISIDIDEKTCLLPAGPLEPVLLNGMRNAVEACMTTEQLTRRVDVSISINSNRMLMIFVSDNGPGLNGPDIFGTTNKPGGHGIGLELSRDIVEALGGTLQVMNVPFGQGAVFKAYVPIEKLVTV